MVIFPALRSPGWLVLSVLALSSRFDGPVFGFGNDGVETDFQYSLCRVVLMVQCL